MTARPSVLLSGVILLVMSSVGIAEDEQLQKYKHIWAAVRTKVESGIIHYKQYSGSNFVLRDHDKVRELLNKMKNRDDYSAIVREVVCTLNGVKVPDNAPEYPEHVLYFKGDTRRIERYGRIEILIGDVVYTEARHVKVNDPSMQITIVDKNAPVHRIMEQLWDFYHFPSAEVADAMSVVSRQMDSDRIDSSRNRTYLNGASFIIDNNADIREIMAGNPKGTMSEQLYSAFKEFDGVRLPQLVFNGTYIDGTLARASISTIVDANFSVKIEDSVFVQDAKAGDIVMDNRNGKHTVNLVQKDLEDVTKASFRNRAVEH